MPNPARGPVGALRRGYRFGRKQFRRVRNHLLLLTTKALNRVSRRSVTGSGPVIVSLTTFGERAAISGYAIESIARGAVRPSRLILWLDDRSILNDPPAPLRRLVARGLELRATPDYGPHKKYYPAVKESIAGDLPLVTADDDTLYPRQWLAKLLKAYADHPDEVACHRAWVVRVEDGGITPYDTWPNCRSSQASPANFATGVSGVLYPPRMQAALAELGTGFVEVAPRTDDIWLHRAALRSGIPIRQVSSRPVHFPTIPGTHESSLMRENVGGSGNDAAIRRAYDARDIRTLESALTRP